MGKKTYMGREYTTDPWGGIHFKDNADSPTMRAQTAPNIVTPEKEPAPKRPLGLPAPEDVTGPSRKRMDLQVADGNTATEKAVVVANAANSNQKKSAHETQIIDQRPHYGIAECVTVTLPYTQYFSVIARGGVDAVSTDWRIRMSSINDIFVDAITTPAGGSAFAHGIYNRMVGTGQPINWPSAGPPDLRLKFPYTPTAAERPTWAQWYTTQYQMYTVLKTEWEMTINNPFAARQADMLLAWDEEAYTTSSTGNVIPDGTTAIYTEQWPGLKWKVLHSNSNGAPEENWCTIGGTYYPGQANKNVRNDEEVSTWTKVNEVPSLKEQVHFKLWKAAFNDYQNGQDTAYQAVNIRLHMRLTVQFRDLQEALRYPGVAALTLSAATDIPQN